MSMKQIPRGGHIAPCLRNYCAIQGYCNDSIAISRSVRPLRPRARASPRTSKKSLQGASKCDACQEPLNGPFLNGLFSRGFFQEVGHGPLRYPGKQPIKVGQKRPSTACVWKGRCVYACGRCQEKLEAPGSPLFVHKTTSGQSS